MSLQEKHRAGIVSSLREAVAKEPFNLQAKKYLAQELNRIGEDRDAYLLCLEILEHEQDLDIERILCALEKTMPVADLADIREQAKRLMNKLDSKSKEKITFADVAGMSKVKEAIRKGILYPLMHPEFAAAYGIKAGGALLLYGPPGCGKTFISRAIAGEINAHFISCSLHEIMGSYFGESNKSLNRLFETARQKAPSVVFIDEIDAIAAKRSRVAGSMRTLVTQLLVELDGHKGYNENVFVIAATNRPWDIDDAMIRSGRLKPAMFIPPPDFQARAEIFNLNLVACPCAEDIDLAEVARLSKGLSSADIKQACDTAKESAFRLAIISGRVVAISQEILVNAVNATRPSTTQWLETAGAYVTHSNAAGRYDDIKAYLKDGN